MPGLVGGCCHEEAGDSFSLTAGLSCDWLGECIWLSLIGPKFEAWAKIMEAVQY